MSNETYIIASTDDIAPHMGEVAYVDARGAYEVAVMRSGRRVPLGVPLCSCTDEVVA